MNFKFDLLSCEDYIASSLVDSLNYLKDLTRGSLDEYVDPSNSSVSSNLYVVDNI